jgi:hypothetical protein
VASTSIPAQTRPRTLHRLSFDDGGGPMSQLSLMPSCCWRATLVVFTTTRPSKGMNGVTSARLKAS